MPDQGNGHEAGARVMAGYSLAQIKAAYAQKRAWEQQLPLTYYVVRPLSFYLTWLIIRVTERPTLVVWVGFGVGVWGCLACAFLPEWGPWPGLLLLMLFSLLDTVDGNIARVTKQVSSYGRFLDGVVGGLVEGLWGFCLAVGLARAMTWPMALELDVNLSANPLSMLVAGTIMVAGRLFSQIVSMAYYKLWSEQHAQEQDAEDPVTTPYKNSIFRGNFWFTVWTNLHTLNVQLALCALCAVLERLHLWVGAFALYYVLRLVITLAFFTVRARQRLS